MVRYVIVSHVGFHICSKNLIIGKPINGNIAVRVRSDRTGKGGCLPEDYSLVKWCCERNKAYLYQNMD